MNPPTRSGSDNVSTLKPAVDARVGSVLDGRYRLLGQLGEGGMGVVYAAEHTIIHKKVAIKLLHSQYVSDEMIVQRFVNEARAAAKIGHPNIVDCTDAGQTADGAPFLVLEYLEGESYDQTLKRNLKLSPGRAVDVAVQVASALDASHRVGIVHRDLKPENIFIVDGGEKPSCVKVLDFGVSKFADTMAEGPGTATGAILGTPHYMAPEQIVDSSSVDGRADIYALGVILYESLSGERLLKAQSLPALFMAIVSEEPLALEILVPELPTGLTAAVTRAIQKDRDERFATMAEFAAAIAGFANTQQVEALFNSSDMSFDDTLDSSSLDLALLPRAKAEGSGYATVALPEGMVRRTLPLRLLAALALIAVGAVGVWFAASTQDAADSQSASAPAAPSDSTAPSESGSAPAQVVEVAADDEGASAQDGIAVGEAPPPLEPAALEPVEAPSTRPTKRRGPRSGTRRPPVAVMEAAAPTPASTPAPPPEPAAAPTHTPRTEQVGQALEDF